MRQDKHNMRNFSRSSQIQHDVFLETFMWWITKIEEATKIKTQISKKKKIVTKDTNIRKFKCN